MRQRQGSATDLVTLGHPLVFLSIIILLINDHIFKVYSPSWLSGKLSDFAGLFFFPILLSAILNIVFKPLRWQPRHIALAAFASTAFWFFQIKTQPFFGNLTETFLSQLLSGPTQIVSDATDLLALVMLLPAWKLRSVIEQRGNARSSRYSYLTLCLASIATLATSPPALPPEVRHLIVHESKIYANFTYEDEILYSSDGGKTWIEVDFDLPAQVTSKLGQFPELPVTLCLPDNPAVCYRTGDEEIMASLDGGKSWSTSWNIPPGRRKYVELYSYQLDLGPYDLALLELDGKQVLVAAMGTEGVLVKADDGAWQSYAVGYAGPMPSFGASGLRNAMGAVSTELNWITFFSIVVLFLNVLVNVSRRDDKGFGVLKIVAVIAIISAIVTIFTAVTAILPGIVLFAGGLLALVCALAAILLLFQQLLTNTTRRGMTGFVMLLMTWLISCALFISWAFGIIPLYETARNGVILLYAAYLLWFLYQLVTKMLKKENHPDASSART